MEANEGWKDWALSSVDGGKTASMGSRKEERDETRDPARPK